MIINKFSLTWFGRPLASSLTAVIYLTAAFVIFCIPPLYHDHAAAIFPDEQTLIAAYSIASSCDFRSPLGDTGSYACSAMVLKSIGVDAASGPWFGAFISAALTIVPFLRGRRIPMRLFLVACAWGVVRATFLAVLSKDLIAAFLVLFLTLFAGRRAFGTAWFIGGMVYGWVIRKYWMLATLTWLGLRYVRKWLTPWRVFIGVVVLYFLFALAFQVVLGKSLDFARSSMNENRVVGAQGSQTIIEPIFTSPNVALQAINSMLVLLRLVFPIELLRFLSPEKIAFVALTPITVWWSMKVVWASIRTETPQLIEAGKVALVPLAFLVVEGIFEPDFGSFARHFSMVSPLVFSAIATAGSHAGIFAKGGEVRGG